jgi:hypothetical protein
LPAAASQTATIRADLLTAGLRGQRRGRQVVEHHRLRRAGADDQVLVGAAVNSTL